MLKLPPVIEAYIQGKNKHDSGAMLACFAEDAIVQDEGQELHGPAAIKKWLDETNAKYRVTVTPNHLVNSAHAFVLTAQVAGSFAGSPVSLDYHFIISQDKISRLSISLTGQ